MTLPEALVTVAVALLSSGGLWTFLQFVVGRRSEAARLVAQKERDDEAEKAQKARDVEAEKEKAKDRAQLLADAQATAQKTALDSANKAYEQVTQRCDKCYDELHLLRAAADTLLDVFEAFMADDTPETRLSVRAEMRKMRQVL